MIPTIPVSVWDQIAVVVVFCFLLGTVGYGLVKMFTTAISDINKHYASVISETNGQWQRYFDARTETSTLMMEKQIQKMDEISRILQGLVRDFENHDRMVTILSEKIQKN